MEKEAYTRLLELVFAIKLAGSLERLRTGFVWIVGDKVWQLMEMFVLIALVLKYFKLGLAKNALIQFQVLINFHA